MSCTREKPSHNPSQNTGGTQHMVTNGKFHSPKQFGSLPPAAELSVCQTSSGTVLLDFSTQVAHWNQLSQTLQHTVKQLYWTKFGTHCIAWWCEHKQLFIDAFSGTEVAWVIWRTRNTSSNKECTPQRSPLRKDYATPKITIGANISVSFVLKLFYWFLCYWIQWQLKIMNLSA